MQLLTKQTDYAIRALIELARDKDTLLSARAISERQKIPYQFLRRTLRVLKQNGIIESREGADGGVKLGRDPGDISVTDVTNIFQGKIELSSCMFRRKICQNRETCVLRPEIQRIQNMVEKEFTGLTIEKLVDKLEDD